MQCGCAEENAESSAATRCLVRASKHARRRPLLTVSAGRSDRSGHERIAVFTLGRAHFGICLGLHASRATATQDERLSHSVARRKASHHHRRHLELSPTRRDGHPTANLPIGSIRRRYARSQCERLAGPTRPVRRRSESEPSWSSRARMDAFSAETRTATIHVDLRDNTTNHSTRSAPLRERCAPP